MPMIGESTPVAFADPLPDSVDVVVIGGGIAGVSTALFLAERGVAVLKLLKVAARDVRLKPGAPRGFPGAWGTKRRWSPDEVSPFERMRVLNPAPSERVVGRIRGRMGRRFPALAGTEIAEAWAGMIDVTPDAVPVLGEDPRIGGLHYATGLSGHGFGIGPAIGRIMVDLLTGRDPGHDLSRFRPGRFFDGSEIVPGPY